MEKDEAILMIADSEVDSNLYYATRFIAPDPFVFIQTSGKKTEEAQTIIMTQPI